MAVLFDVQDDYVRSVLDRAQARSEISLADLESTIKAGKGGEITPNENDIADTIDALVATECELTGSVSPDRSG
jgi:hypothetical protein